MIKKVFSFILILFSFSFLMIRNVLAWDNSYGYNYYGEILASPSAYMISKTKSFNELKLIKDIDYKKEKIVDLIKDEEIIYLLTDISLIVFDENYNILKKVNSFSTPDSVNDNFNNNLSMAKRDNYLYICDDNPTPLSGGGLKSRILIFKITNSPDFILLNKDDIKVLRMTSSKEVPGIDKSGFRPHKIKVSRSGKIFVIAKDIYQGIIELDINGKFNRFVGTNKIKINATERFWRKITPKKARRKTYLPTSFESLDIDNSGFIYATTASVDVKPIQKLNYKGDNVLIENGNIPVVGDMSKEIPSKFIDIAINDYGVYLVLDLSIPQDKSKLPKGRIFSYNSSGDLLYIIGNYEEDSLNYFTKPEKIMWDDNQIIVIDNDPTSPRIQYLKETEYGRNINLATKKYYEGDFKEAKENWEKVITLDTNKELSYIGLGKIYYQEENYQKALEYFKLGNNKVFYGKAYNYLRNEKLKVAFLPVVLSLILVIFIVKGIKLWIKIKKGK